MIHVSKVTFLNLNASTQHGTLCNTESACMEDVSKETSLNLNVSMLMHNKANTAILHKWNI